MLKDYTELINKHFAKDLRKPMRDAAKQLYDESLDGADHIVDHISQVWVPSDGKVDPLRVEDAVVELLYECAQRGYRFGDYKVETSEVTDGSPNPKYTHTAVTVRIPIIYKTA